MNRVIPEVLALLEHTWSMAEQEQDDAMHRAMMAFSKRIETAQADTAPQTEKVTTCVEESMTSFSTERLDVEKDRWSKARPLHRSTMTELAKLASFERNGK
jgi:hypothetical protein